TARATSRSCSIQSSCARRICRCRRGSSAAPASKLRSCDGAPMTTDCLFREDAYLTECQARVVGVTDVGGIVVDRTVFYATSGGQPGDRGKLMTEAGTAIPISGAVYTDPAKTVIAQLPADAAGERPAIGAPVTLAIDWDLRYRRMRMHTA